MDDSCTICQYKTKEPPPKYRNICPYFFRSLSILVWNRHAFHRSKVAAFQTCNKKYGIKNISHMSWDTSTLQIHHHSNHWTLFQHKNENFQSTEKINVLVYFLLRRLFTSFRYLNTMVCLKKTDPVTREKSKYFFPSNTLLSTFLTFWVLDA